MEPTYDDLQRENERLKRENEDLRRELDGVRRENKGLSNENGRLNRRCAKLEAQVQQLTELLENSQRQAKRQAAPFRKADGPKPNPKKPGRKKGKRYGTHAHREPPSRIDERYEVPLPDVCPHCGGRHLTETNVDTQYQTEIPREPIYRQFDIHVGCCQDCGRRVQGRHELQTSDALGSAASQLGPYAHAVFVLLNKELGLSHGKCGRVFEKLFGIHVSRSTSARSIHRSAQLAKPAYDQVREEIRGSPWVAPDETGWRVGGRNAWLHAIVGETATYYEIGDRSGDIARRLLGADWSGTMIHDGWSVYDQFKSAFHQQCVAHLQRRCQRLLETAKGLAARLPQNVLQLLDEAFALRRAWRGHRMSADDLAVAGLALACELEALVSRRYINEANRRLAAHIRKHAMQWFWFLIDPSIDATNYRPEQAIRPSTANRKVWGGNRNWGGAGNQGIHLTIDRTLMQRGQDALEWYSQLRRHPSGLLLPAYIR